MKKQLEEYIEKFDSLTLRERIIVMFVFLLVIFMVWDSLVVEPLSIEEETYSQRFESLKEKKQTISQEMQILIQQHDNDPNAEEKSRIQQLEKQIQQINQQIATGTVEVVTPKQMAHLLEKMLAQQANLDLLKLESVDAEVLIKQSESNMPSDDLGQIYKHGMIIEVAGTFFDILAFLKGIEELEWGVLWDAVKIDQQGYPNNFVRVKLHTISLDKSWVGV